MKSSPNQSMMAGMFFVLAANVPALLAIVVKCFHTPSKYDDPAMYGLLVAMQASLPMTMIWYLAIFVSARYWERWTSQMSTWLWLIATALFWVDVGLTAMFGWVWADTYSCLSKKQQMGIVIQG
jgi:hypothetical protein